MAFLPTHVDFQNTDPQEYDRINRLMAEGFFTPSSIIRRILEGKIDRTMLSPDLLVSLTSSTQDNLDSFVVATDGTGQSFLLSDTPIFNPLVSVNGSVQTSGVDYFLTDDTITFTRLLLTGDRVDVRHQATQAAAASILGTFSLSYQNVSDVSVYNSFLFTYGIDKIGPNDQLFAKIDPITFALIGTAINVESGVPDNSPVVRVGSNLWAIGSPSTVVTNSVIEVNPDTMTVLTDLEIVPSTDTAAVIAALASDEVSFLYAYIKGGVVAPHQIAKIDPNGVPVITGTILTNLSPTSMGSVDMAVSQSNHLFVLFSSLNGGNGDVRKYDTGDGSLVATYTDFTTPIKIIAVADKMCVIDSATKKLWEIPTTGSAADIITFVNTPTDIVYDGADLWVSFGEDLLKIKRNGTTLATFNPVVSGQTIQDVTFGIGHIWTTYSNDSGAENITKIDPGLPGV